MTGQTKRQMKTFERRAGPMPALKRAAPAQAAAPSPAGDAGGRGVDADELAPVPMPGFLSQREILLRLVETLKSL